MAAVSLFVNRETAMLSTRKGLQLCLCICINSKEVGSSNTGVKTHQIKEPEVIGVLVILHSVFLIVGGEEAAASCYKTEAVQLWRQRGC